MNLIIRHNKEEVEYGVGLERGTVVLEKPHAAEILQEMRKQFLKSAGLPIPTVTLNIGASFAHPKDPFNKKIGRKLASERIRPVVCTIRFGEYQNFTDAIHLTLEGVDDKSQVKYDVNIKIYRDSGDLRVMSVSTRSWK